MTGFDPTSCASASKFLKTDAEDYQALYKKCIPDISSFKTSKEKGKACAERNDPARGVMVSSSGGMNPFVEREDKDSVELLVELASDDPNTTLASPEFLERWQKLESEVIAAQKK